MPNYNLAYVVTVAGVVIVLTIDQLSLIYLQNKANPKKNDFSAPCMNGPDCCESGSIDTPPKSERPPTDISDHDHSHSHSHMHSISSNSNEDYQHNEDCGMFI